LIFDAITDDLRSALKSDMAQIRFLLKKNPGEAYRRITEIGYGVGRRHKLELIVNFPHEGKIEEFEMYGRRDLSIIVDKEKKRFPIDREIIKEKARLIFKDAEVKDAYMYEDKEGVKVFFEGGRIDILPHSLHIWCEFTPAVAEFCNWLLGAAYQIKR